MQEVLAELIPRILRCKSYECTSIKDVREEAEDRLGLLRGGLDDHREALTRIIKDYVYEHGETLSDFRGPGSSPSGRPHKRRRVDLTEASLAGWQDMWQNRRFTDAVVRCQGQSFAVHRAVLGSRSPVLAAMFAQEGLREGAERQLAISDAEPQLVEAMLRYMYIGEVTEDTDCSQLLRLADQYEVEGLIEVCCTAMLQDLSPETVAGSLCCLRKHRHREAVKAAYERLLLNVQHDKELLRALAEHVSTE